MGSWRWQSRCQTNKVRLMWWTKLPVWVPVGEPLDRHVTYSNMSISGELSASFIVSSMRFVSNHAWREFNLAVSFVAKFVSLEEVRNREMI